MSVFPFLISTLLSLDSSSTANQVLGIPSACCVCPALFPPLPHLSLSLPLPLPLLPSSFTSLLFLSCSVPICSTLFAGLHSHSSAADVYRPYQVSSSSTIPFVSTYLPFFDLFDPLLFFSLSHSSYSFAPTASSPLVRLYRLVSVGIGLLVVPPGPHHPRPVVSLPGTWESCRPLSRTHGCHVTIVPHLPASRISSCRGSINRSFCFRPLPNFPRLLCHHSALRSNGFCGFY